MERRTSPRRILANALALIIIALVSYLVVRVFNTVSYLELERVVGTLRLVVCLFFFTTIAMLKFIVMLDRERRQRAAEVEK
jgi:hypothetical protein